MIAIHDPTAASVDAWELDVTITDADDLGTPGPHLPPGTESSN